VAGSDDAAGAVCLLVQGSGAGPGVLTAVRGAVLLARELDRAREVSAALERAHQDVAGESANKPDRVLLAGVALSFVMAILPDIKVKS